MTYRVRNPDLHQEEDHLPVWQVIIGLIVVFAVSAVMIVWAVQATSGASARQRPSGAYPERWIGPRHSVARVRQDVFGERRGESLKSTQTRDLESYGVVDPERRIVRIPIDRAIDLYLQGRRP